MTVTSQVAGQALSQFVEFHKIAAFLLRRSSDLDLNRCHLAAADAQQELLKLQKLCHHYNWNTKERN